MGAGLGRREQATEACARGGREDERRHLQRGSRLRGLDGTDEHTHPESVIQNGRLPACPLMRPKVRAYSHQGHDLASTK
jgi:hypothetical protein